MGGEVLRDLTYIVAVMGAGAAVKKVLAIRHEIHNPLTEIHYAVDVDREVVEITVRDPTVGGGFRETV